jgi:hypothetical protein
MPETVLRQLTFVIDVMDVDDGDERLDLKRSSEIGLARADNTPPQVEVVHPAIPLTVRKCRPNRAV